MQKTQQAAIKLIKKFDNELKNILLTDLKALNMKNQFASHHVIYTMTAA